MRAPIRRAQPSDKLSPREKETFDRRRPNGYIVNVTEDLCYFAIHGDPTVHHIRRDELHDRFSDSFSRRENLRSREDPGISGDLDRYDDLVVGRYEKKPAQRRRPNSATFAAPIDGAARGVPEWIKLIPGGRIDCRDDRGPFHMADPERVIQATHEFELLHDAGLPIDLNHSTDIAAKEGGEAPAVGWIEELQVRAGDLYGRVEWTAKGLAAVSRGPNGEPPAYRYISPVFSYDPKTLAVLQLLRAGLTNNPNLYRSAICSRNSRETEDSLTGIETNVCRHLGISSHTFAAAKMQKELRRTNL